MLIVLNIFLLCLIYLLGAFPTGYLVAKSHGISIHDHGSGNVGATNVARVVGKKAGILTLAGDLVKGLAGVGIARLVWHDGAWVSAATVFVVLGHCISIPGKLKGGKGVATSLGAMLALYPPSALVGVIAFGVLMIISRIVSLSSIGAAAAISLFALATGVREDVSIALCSISAVVIARHHANIKRLIEGNESRFGKKEPT